MIRPSLHWGLAVSCAMWGFSVAAQPVGEAHRASPTNTPQMAPVPPPATAPRSPVEAFRELLAMPPVEQHRALATRSPENRKLILDKIREYQAMNPEQREIRLEVTELRWYLWPLMKMEATNRTARLESMPAEMRKLVEQRLRLWDLLPPQLQQELMQNEATARIMSEIATGIRSPASSPQQYETNSAAWNSMSENKRREISLLFSNFFMLSEPEQEKVVRRLSPEEQRQIEKTLQVFQDLPPIQRSQCIRSFAKFASLSPAERKEFILNAQRWESMSAADRQVFRELVERTASQPPLPSAGPPIPPPNRPGLPRLPDTATNR